MRTGIGNCLLDACNFEYFCLLLFSSSNFDFTEQLEEYAVHPLVHPNNQLLARQLMATSAEDNPILPIECVQSTHPLTGADQQIYLVGEKKFQLEDVKE